MQIEKPETRKLNAAEIVDRLRAEAAKDRTFNDICHVFSLRERARGQVTIAALQLTLIKEGFTHDKEEIRRVFKLMAGLGLGTLDLAPNKIIRGLKDIKVSLQSIGMSALDPAEQLEKFNQPVKYLDLPVPKPKSKPLPQAAQKAPKVETSKPPVQTRRYKASIKITIDGKDLEFDLPKQVSMLELTFLLNGGYLQAGGQ